MKVVAAGVSGFLGTQLTQALTAAGHTVVRLVRSEPTGPDESLWNPHSGDLDSSVFDGADAVAVMHAWRAWQSRLTENTTTSVAILRMPDMEAVPPPPTRHLTDRNGILPPISSLPGSRPPTHIPAPAPPRRGTRPWACVPFARLGKATWNMGGQE